MHISYDIYKYINYTYLYTHTCNLLYIKYVYISCINKIYKYMKYAYMVK